MVEMLRKTEKALGKSSFQVNEPSLKRYRNVVRKRAIYRYDLPEGHVLSAEDLIFKRSDIGLMPDELEYFLGRSLKKTVGTEQPILKEDFI